MPLKIQEQLCTCSSCKLKDVNGIGITLPVELVKLHKARDTMGFNKRKDSRRSGGPLIAAFSNMTVGEDAHLTHKMTTMTVIDRPSMSKERRNATIYTDRALKVLNSVRDETLVLQEQFLEEIESEDGLSLEFLVRMERRLETLGIAVERTTRQEPEIVSLKGVVIENLETLQAKCEAQRAAVPRLRDTDPISFSSGKLPT